MEKVKISVFLPSLLAHCVGGRDEIEVEATTLEEAVAEVLRCHPLLEVHLFDEQQKVRSHVNLFHNNDNVARAESWRNPLRPGDTLTIIQAVSGG